MYLISYSFRLRNISSDFSNNVNIENNYFRAQLYWHPMFWESALLSTPKNNRMIVQICVQSNMYRKIYLYLWILILWISFRINLLCNYCSVFSHSVSCRQKIINAFYFISPTQSNCIVFSLWCDYPLRYWVLMKYY